MLARIEIIRAPRMAPTGTGNFMLKDRLQPLADRTRALAPAQLHSFWRNGYLVVDALFDQPALEELRRLHGVTAFGRQPTACVRHHEFLPVHCSGLGLPQVAFDTVEFPQLDAGPGDAEIAVKTVGVDFDELLEGVLRGQIIVEHELRPAIQAEHFLILKVLTL